MHGMDATCYRESCKHYSVHCKHCSTSVTLAFQLSSIKCAAFLYNTVPSDMLWWWYTAGANQYGVNEDIYILQLHSRTEIALTVVISTLFMQSSLNVSIIYNHTLTLIMFIMIYHEGSQYNMINCQSIDHFNIVSILYSIILKCNNILLIQLICNDRHIKGMNGFEKC